MRRLLPTLAAFACVASSVLAQSGDNVLLVVNEDSADSGRVGEYYARTRGVPQTQLLRGRWTRRKTKSSAASSARGSAPVAAWTCRIWA